MTVEARGAALFSGEQAVVRFSAQRGPTSLHTARGGGPLATWSPTGAFRTTAIAHESSARVACVEHLFAALAAFGAYEDLRIFVEGNELPILDGACAAWCALLEEVRARPSPSPLRVAREETLEVGESTYRFAPGSQSSVAVQIDLSHAGSFAESLPRHAEWNGTRADFVEKIASARTFVLERDLAGFALESEAHAPPETFIVIGETTAYARGREFDPNEPARHKLLDFLGDLFAHGGPPTGRIEATRPGHARNHEAMRRAAQLGVFARA